MRQTNWFLTAVFVCGLCITSTAAKAQILLFQPPAVTVSVGYSNFQPQKANNLFYDHSGSYIDADFAWRLPTVIPLQAGFGFSGSGYWKSKSLDQALNGNFYDDYDRLDSDVGLFEIEPRLGLHLGRETGFFAVPRIGAGLLLDSYDIDQVYTNNGNTYLDTRDHSGAAVELRPAIQAGYSWGPAAAGLEASYLYSWGDFGGLGHEAQEFRIGAFLTFNF